MPNRMLHAFRFLALILLAACLPGRALAGETLPGYVIHFDFIRNAEEGVALVEIAQKAGAKVIDVVPPAKVWDHPPSLAALDAILAEIQRRGLKLAFTRIDAAYLPEGSKPRSYFIYDQMLTDRGRLPNGQKTEAFFLTTVGVPGYAEWMEEETRFYARRYGKLPHLVGINLGPFSEPFSAQRCGFLEYMLSTDRYEITQYTKPATRVWQRWLKGRFKSIKSMNREYGLRVRSFECVPLPLNESDRRFRRPDLAYFDFVRCLGDWYRERYERCRRIWHAESGRSDVPFILQFSGFVAEKLAAGRPAYVAFDLPGWIANADAVGLSVYTHDGYKDQGRATLQATVQLLALAKDMGKEAYVLEGGCEAPNVVVAPELLAIFGSAAQPLAPRTYIYEYLKDKFDEAYATNPGKLVTGDGKIRPEAFEALKTLFQGMEASSPPGLPAPRLCLEVDLDTCRRNPHFGKLNAALFDLASELPLRWFPKGVEVAAYAGIPTVHSDGRITNGSPELEALLVTIPEIGTLERQAWARRMIALLGQGGSSR